MILLLFIKKKKKNIYIYIYIYKKNHNYYFNNIINFILYNQIYKKIIKC